MKTIELFAGAGGLAVGLKASGIKSAALIELNKDACATLRLNRLVNKEQSLYEGDIKDFDFSDFVDCIDMISGGPPCQPFSLGGKHNGETDNRDMFPQAVRAIREVKPKTFIFENVKGLLRKSFAEYFEYILLQLQYPSIEKNSSEIWQQHLSRLEKNHTQNKHMDLEYKVVFRLINSANYGVAQKRERVIIVGFRSDLNVEWSFPEATHSEDALFWSKWIKGDYWKRHEINQPEIAPVVEKKIHRILKKYGMLPPIEKPWVTVRDALSDLPPPGSKDAEQFLNHEFRHGAKSYKGHTGSDIDEPSKTLKAGVHGVPGGENMIRFEDGSVRYFSIRESARIQSFPDDFEFYGAWGEIMRQLGNAVPAKVAEIIGRSIKKALQSNN